MTAPEFNFGLLIEAEDLVPYLGNEHLRIVDLSRSSVYEQLHIPHAIQLKPKQLVAQHEDATGVLPSIEQLQQLVSILISRLTTMSWSMTMKGAWAGRLIWNLHCLGFTRTSLLNGGFMHGWVLGFQPLQRSNR